MGRVLLLNAVGLTPRMVGTETPRLAALAARGGMAPMDAVLPGVTCTAQATMLTGTLPSEHGAVANGWYFPDVGEVFLWRQPNECIRGKKLYDLAKERDPSFTCAKLFWWWNMGAAVDWSITPRPFYPADGRKILAVYGWPREYPERIERELGDFPFFDFWGPKAGMGSSEWIAAATRSTLDRERPTLTMAYLPHLDYDLQRYGPSDPRATVALRELDRIVGELVDRADADGITTVVVSEYGMEDVDRPVELNRHLRRAGLLDVRPGPAGEMLDFFASRAFCVCDHQLAHVYCRDERTIDEVRELFGGVQGIAAILDEDGKREHGLDHERSGDLVCVAEKGAWFAYPYWLDDALAPDFARTVDIHRKPGYDPCELFVDPKLRAPILRVVRRLAQKKLGMRYLMDVIPLDPTLVGGSHGRIPDDPLDGPVFLSGAPLASAGGEPENGSVAMTSVRDRILALLAG